MSIMSVCDHTSSGGEETLDLPKQPLAQELPASVNIIVGKGEFLDGGVTGLVELLQSGHVVKSPWTGRPTASDCRREMAIEALVYQRLGQHPRLVPMKSWDPVDHALTLEYMRHGNLREYLRRHGQEISSPQRTQWVMQAAEGVELLHYHGIIQGDVGPHNFLLDADLGLKICDFGGSSVDGSQATVVPGVRYRLPGPGGRHVQPATIQEDLFGLGSTIYSIVNGYEPYNDLEDENQIERLYMEGVFPELGGVPFAQVIALCWQQEAESAQVIIKLIGRLSAQVVWEMH